MTFQKIEKAFQNSQFFENYQNIDDILQKFKNIKNNYKNELIQFIHEFIKYYFEDKYLEKYVLYLIRKFGFTKIKEELEKFDDQTYNKLYNINSLKIFLDKNISGDIVYKNCTPEYFMENRFLDKNRLKNNKKMDKFFNKFSSYQKILKGKIELKHNIKKYVKFSDNITDTLFGVATSGNLKNFKNLANNWTDIHVNNDYALVLASIYGHLGIVKYMIQNNADIHTRNESVLIEACENGHTDIVKFLVENGANLNIDHADLYTLACKKGHLDVIKFLVENNVKMRSGVNFIISIASRCGYIDIVNFLEGIYGKIDYDVDDCYGKIFIPNIEYYFSDNIINNDQLINIHNLYYNFFKK